MSTKETLEISPNEPASDYETPQQTEDQYSDRSVSDKLDHAKTLLGEVAVIGEVVKPYAPLISSLTDSIRRIYNSYDYAQYNKRISNVLLDRVDCVGAPIKALKRRKDKIETNFLNQNYYNALIRLLAVLKKTQQFITDVSSLWSLRKFPTTNNIKERFDRISKEFDDVIMDLNLEVPQDRELQKKRDAQALQVDITILNEFLEKIGNPVTTSKKQISPIFEEIILIKSHINENNGNNEIKITQIPPTELINNTRPKANDQYGNVLKRLWQVSGKYVACKRFDTQQTQKFQEQLVLLKKLNNCSSIIKFHGLSTLEWGSGQCTVIVYEWAEQGNLKTLYEKFTIDWPSKLDISVGICRGLLFLHGCDIMHHDVRCENILINENLEPKIANFRLCRPIHDDKEFKNVSDPPEHWMAPEQFRNDKKVGYYTYKCDVFSFGMLLWEFAFERVPYREWNEEKIAKHVLAGNREKIDQHLTSSQQKFTKIIRAAWQDDPALRPGLYKMFLKLEALRVESPKDKTITKLNTKKYDDNDEIINIFTEDETQIADVNELESMDLINEIVPSIRPFLRLSEGIKAHEQKEYKKAFECFESHASINNARAKCWKGYYLWEGLLETTDRNEAIKLFKEAADENVPEAMYYYAESLIENDTLKNTDDYLHYLTLAANYNNIDAFYTLGETLWYGKYGINKDEKKAQRYLRLAAMKEYSKA
ncbi:15903_t:CDS:2, partial [Gigaspora margarita]